MKMVIMTGPSPDALHLWIVEKDILDAQDTIFDNAVYQFLGESTRVGRILEFNWRFSTVISHQADIHVQTDLVRFMRGHKSTTAEADISKADSRAVGVCPIPICGNCL